MAYATRQTHKAQQAEPEPCAQGTEYHCLPKPPQKGGKQARTNKAHNPRTTEVAEKGAAHTSISHCRLVVQEFRQKNPKKNQAPEERKPQNHTEVENRSTEQKAYKEKETPLEATISTRRRRYRTLQTKQNQSGPRLQRATLSKS